MDHDPDRKPMRGNSALGIPEYAKASRRLKEWWARYTIDSGFRCAQNDKSRMACCAEKISKGCSWEYCKWEFDHCAGKIMDPPDTIDNSSLGFRCCIDTPPTYKGMRGGSLVSLHVKPVRQPCEYSNRQYCYTVGFRCAQETMDCCPNDEIAGELGIMRGVSYNHYLGVWSSCRNFHFRLDKPKETRLGFRCVQKQQETSDKISADKPVQRSARHSHNGRGCLSNIRDSCHVGFRCIGKEETDVKSIRSRTYGDLFCHDNESSSRSRAPRRENDTIIGIRCSRGIITGPTYEELILIHLSAAFGALSNKDYKEAGKALHRAGLAAKHIHAEKEETMAAKKQTASTSATNRAAGVEKINEKDGSVLVWVPPGIYPQGSDDGYDDEKPAHKVRLGGFWMQKYPVTNKQYMKFVEETGHRKPSYHDNADFNGDEQPVVGVSWDDACAYASWAGLVLPQESQWEAAARGPEGRTYPWGEDPPTKELCNFNMNVKKTTPVGAYPKGVSWCGCHDMSGNVWEWCADEYDAKAYEKREKVQ